MATLVTTNQVHIAEDIGNVINNITPEETPVYSMIAKTKATNTRHEFFTETLNAPNASNAAPQGADFVDSALTSPVRLGNYTQISTKVINVSGTLQAVKTVGSNNEFGRQVGKAGVELRKDIEAGDLTGWLWTGLIERISQDRRSRTCGEVRRRARSRSC